MSGINKESMNGEKQGSVVLYNSSAATNLIRKDLWCSGCNQHRHKWNVLKLRHYWAKFWTIMLFIIIARYAYNNSISVIIMRPKLGHYLVDGY